MTDQERREWIDERAALVHEGAAGEIDYFTAKKRAAEMYQEMLDVQKSLF